MRTVYGERIAAARNLRGLTQQALADRAHISVSLLQKVETGHVPATPGMVTAVARALRVDLGQLTGQPYRGDTPDDDQADAAVAELRDALWKRGPGDDLHVPTNGRQVLTDLQPALAVAGKLRADAQPVQLAEHLPALVHRLLTATDMLPPGRLRDRAYGALTDVYAMAVLATLLLGYHDLAMLASERMAWAAECSGDELWVATAAERRSYLDLVLGAYEPGLRAVSVAAARAAATAASGVPPGPEVLTVVGRLHLRAGILAARAGWGDRARQELAAAADQAALLPSARHRPAECYGMVFGPAPVRIHWVAAEVALGEGTRAVELAAGWNPAGQDDTDRHWVGLYHVDVARAQLMHGDRDAALAELDAARRVAPQLAQRHPDVRETLDVLARVTRRVSEPLRALVAWARVNPGGTGGVSA